MTSVRMTSLLVVLMCIASGWVVVVDAQAPPVAPLPSSWIRGTNFFAMEAESFSANSTLAALQSLKETMPGVDMVSAQWMWEQEAFNSTKVIPAKRTPTTESLILFTRTAHAAGLKGYFKPLVVAKDGAQMAELNPSDISLWFQSYGSMVLEMAALAQLLSVEKFACGIEYQILSTNVSNLPHWQHLIASIRSVYTGELTYGSVPLSYETQRIPFWDLVDDIGVDIYIPVISPLQPNATLTPTVEEMTGVYVAVLEARLMNWYVNSTLALLGKKMFISESGYPSSNAGIRMPWVLPSRADGCTGNFVGNQTAQAAALAVQFNVLNSPTYSSYFSGFMQFWYGIVDNGDFIGAVGTKGSLYACGWTPVGKNESMSVLASAFARSSSGN